MASMPVETPPTPTMGRSGKAWWTSWTARTATGWMAGPDSPPPPPPRRSWRDSVSMAMPRTVLIRVTASAPAPCAASAMGTRLATLGLSLAHSGRPQACEAAHRLGGGLGELGEHLATVVEVGARQVDLDRHHLGRGIGQGLGRRGVVVDRPPPDAGHHRCAGGEQRRQLVVEPGGHPGALQADRVQHAALRLVHPRRRVAGPGLGRQRLHHHRSQRRQVQVASELVTVPGRPRRRHDRIGKARPTRPRSPGSQLRASNWSALADARPAVVLLEAADLEGVAGPVGHAVGRGQAGRHGGQQGHAVGPRRGADVGAVGPRDRDRGGCSPPAVPSRWR